MQDKLGLELKVGDQVLFAKGGQQDTGIYLGEILEIEEKLHASPQYRFKAKIKNLENSRIMQNKKYGFELVSITPHKCTNPELFI